MSRGLLALLALLAALLATASSAHAELRTAPCPGMREFGCTTIKVPLDRTGRLPGFLELRVAAQRPERSRRGVVLALSGGPGQGAVGFARAFAESLGPLLRDRRLVVLDQRGTGRSAAVNCPALQRIPALDPVRPSLIAECARRQGPARQLFGTIDTVADLEDLRAALGVERLTIMGISYGTFVAQQYARTYPNRVERLVLDSVLSDDGFDPFLVDSFGRMGRVLREQCARGRCRRATADPVGDAAALTQRLAAGPITARIPDRRGRLREARLDHSARLFLLVQTGDLNPFLQPAMPGALAAARAGDTAPLLRAARIANGPNEGYRSFSLGLNVTTACADSALPYTFDQPVAERAGRVETALGAVAPDVVAPFDLAAVRAVSIAEDCLLWPEGDLFAGPSKAPLPDVPALLLNGRLDIRTPYEGAKAVARGLPRSSVVGVPGTGHDVLGADLTGCAELALDRFARGRAVGRPCKGQTNQVPPFQRPPRSLDEVRRVPALAGRRGRVVEAVLESVSDAQLTALATAFAGFKRFEGGGLRGGWFSARGLAEAVRLRSYSYVPGVRVSGRIGADGGLVRVTGVRGASGVLRLDGLGGVRGRLGGRRIDLTADQTDEALDAVAAGAAGGRGTSLRAAARVALRAAGRYQSSRSSSPWSP